MKYLVYANTGLSSKQIGLTAEYIEKCKRDNVDLKIVMCDNVLENCYFNPLHNCIACASCQSRSLGLMKQSGINDSDIIKLKKYKVEIEFPIFENLNDLLNYSFEGINIGRGAASSIISYYRDYHISTKKYKEIIDLELKKSINVYYNFKEIINSENPDKVILFNGRFSEIYPLLEYCNKINLKYTSIESGSKNKYELFENSLPHSVSYRHKRMMELWDNEPNIEQKFEIAHNWFKKKRDRDDSIEISYTKNQEYDLLPEGFNKNKNNILILNSSEDEMKVIEEYSTDLFDTQNEAINKIVNHFKIDKTTHFYLRVHPNLGAVNNVQIDEINKMDYENLTIISPFENIDTYALIDACDKTIVFGSTSGIEATYWGNASILLGKSFYYYLENTCYKPNSFDELYQLILDIHLKPQSQEACLPYGYYYSIFGIETEYFIYDGLKNSTFKGKKIDTWNLYTFKYLAKYLFKLNNWSVAYKAITGNKLKLSDLFRYKI